MAQEQVVILGAGMTGLAAGLASGLPVYEAGDVPGGICASYYVSPGNRVRASRPPPDGDAYRFDLGGGHWLWGGDPLVMRFINSITPLKSCTRKAAVYLPERDLIVPYPIQNHLSRLGSSVTVQVLREMLQNTPVNGSIVTMAEWLHAHFGNTLCQLFFDPFHERYTAGLWQHISPQDASKSPIDISLTLQGALDKEHGAAGYNVRFLYPVAGLNVLAQRLAEQCNIHYGQRVVGIDVKKKTLFFEGGLTLCYKAILSTLPLNTICEMAGLTINAKPDPFTSVMVVNLGARKGARCPEEHWLYVPKSKAGFHRVGFYSNVDDSFLPSSIRENGDRCSIYVEKAYPGGHKPSKVETASLCDVVIQELQGWDWIQDVDVVDPTWIETAYTWVWPKSKWRYEVMNALEAFDIYQIGRYARWAFQVNDQGISQSIRDGLMAGASFRGCV